MIRIANSQPGSAGGLAAGALEVRQ